MGEIVLLEVKRMIPGGTQGKKYKLAVRTCDILKVEQEAENYPVIHYADPTRQTDRHPIGGGSILSVFTYYVLNVPIEKIVQMIRGGCMQCKPIQKNKH